MYNGKYSSLIAGLVREPDQDGTRMLDSDGHLCGYYPKF